MSSLKLVVLDFSGSPSGLFCFLNSVGQSYSYFVTSSRDSLLFFSSE
jgi:hypothetical protein